jgi:hypothetical protein
MKSNHYLSLFLFLLGLLSIIPWAVATGIIQTLTFKFGR